MTTPLNTLLGYSAIDLTPYEIRGAKAGLNNAYSTGPVYDGGAFYTLFNGSPIYGSTITGCDGSFSLSDSTVRILTGVSTYSLRVNDNVIVNDSTYSISGILSSNSFGLDSAPGINGTYPIIFNLGEREYLVEPDTLNNTVIKGLATFTQGNPTITGTSTTWSSDLTSGDYIKADYLQQYFKIKQVLNDTTLALTVPFAGDTSSSAQYTGKRWSIGRTKIQCTKNDFLYDNRSGRWKYDTTTGSDFTTSSVLSPLVDGLDLAFTNSIVQNAPDIMDVAIVPLTTFARQTQHATYQFSLPVVPEANTMLLEINGISRDMFPTGNQDYVLNYTQNPVYSPPPPPALRQVANVMFLAGIPDTTLSSTLTQTGTFLVTDKTGVVINDIMPMSEILKINGVDQTRYRDYAFEYNTGTVEVTSTVINEQIVKYVASDYSQLVYPGFSVYLNGQKQQVSYPAQSSDDLIFQLDFGIVKPRNQDHPGPDDTYEVNYMVEGNVIQNELIPVLSDASVFNSSVFPIKQGSTILQVGNGVFLTEDVDYAVSSLTGQFILTQPVASKTIMNLSYTPLSKQINQLTYTDGTSYCTTIDSRLTVLATNFQFSLVNTQLDPSDITITRVYNETIDTDYIVAGYTTNQKVIQLDMGANNSLGLGLTDVVLINYTFENETLEYFPVIPNIMSLNEGGTFFYFEGLNLTLPSSTSQIVPGTVISATPPDGATQYFFIVENVSYDKVGTRVTLKAPIPTDISNPQILVGDSSVSFVPAPTASPFVSGSSTITFPGTKSVGLFRKGTLLSIGGAVYQVQSASYDTTLHSTVVLLVSGAVQDYVNSSELSSVTCSDVPIYNVGTTEIIPKMPAVTLMSQPAFIVNNSGNLVLNVSTDTSNLYIDGSAFSYALNPHLSDMSSTIASANIDGLTLLNYSPVSNWESNRIISKQQLSVYSGSNTILYASDALRYQYDTTGSVGPIADSSSFSISSSNTVLLTKPLQVYDRYYLDYLGRRYLYDSTVDFSLRYFTQLPAGSKVKASFEFVNLDQFYIQVLDRRDFFDSVTIPRMTNEALQLNDNVGQGGQVASDEGGSNTDGGVVGNEYRKVDAEIECRVFQDIYNYFENRLEAYGNELDAATGLKIFNNDGYFSTEEQTAAFKPVNRIFPFSDYTGMPPVEVNPLTGYFFNTHTVFIQNSYDLTNVGGNSRWTEQLKPGDFIGRYLDPKIYQIQTIVSDSSIVLDSTFQGVSSRSLRGEKYTASTGYPLYDDDGNLGPKLIGSESEDFGLFGGNPGIGPGIPPSVVFTGGDVFDIYLNYGHSDQTYQSYTFADPPITFPPALSFSLFSSKVAGYSAGEVASLLTANIPGLLATAETVLDSATPYGYRTGIVLRATDEYNNILLGYGTAVRKLGFIEGAYVYGNRDRTDHYPEVMADSSEIMDITKEIVDLDILLSDTTYVLDRVFTQMPYALDILTNLVPDGLRVLSQYEIPRLNTEISSLHTLVEEPSLPTYVTDMSALSYAIDADTSAVNALIYDSNIVTNYEGKDTSWAWVLDFAEQSQIVHGITLDGSNTAVPVVGPGDTTIAGQTSFVLVHPDPSFNLKILNSDLLPADGTPVVVYQNNGEPVPGFWTGWDTSNPIFSNYSLVNDATFTMIPTPAVDIGRDPIFSNIRVTTSPTALTFNWTSATSFDTTSFLYADYTSVSNLVGAINVTPGFVATTIQDRVYTSFDLTSNVLLPAYVSLDGTHLFNVSFDMANLTYLTDTTALNFNWTTNSIPQSRKFVYGSQTLSDIVQNVNEITSLFSSVVGNPTDYAASFDMTSGVLPFGAVTLNEGLRDCTVAYQTISDRILDNRLNADTTRIVYLTNRVNYLDTTREPGLMNCVEDEEILRNPDGGPSDLYIWANNRFNRRQGCYSRLNQILQQIASNRSALNVNKSLI
jgi:hypothetical protein